MNVVRILYKLKSFDKQTYLYRYLKQACRFVIIGLMILSACGLLFVINGKVFNTPVLVLLCVGGGLFVIGASSLQSHTIVKSFGYLLMNDPSMQNAKEFLIVLENVGKVSLIKSSKNIVDTALLNYQKSYDYDEEICNKLQAMMSESVYTRTF